MECIVNSCFFSHINTSVPLTDAQPSQSCVGRAEVGSSRVIERSQAPVERAPWWRDGLSCFFWKSVLGLYFHDTLGRQRRLYRDILH